MRSIIIPSRPAMRLAAGIRETILDEADRQNCRMFVFERKNELEITKLLLHMVLDASVVIKGKRQLLEDIWGRRLHIVDIPEHNGLNSIIDTACCAIADLLDSYGIDTSTDTEHVRRVHDYDTAVTSDPYFLLNERYDSPLFPESLLIRDEGHYSKHINRRKEKERSVTLAPESVLINARAIKRSGDFAIPGVVRQVVKPVEPNSLIEELLLESKKTKEFKQHDISWVPTFK